MNTTHDPETPIFGELNRELGELPEIDVHEFDKHAFDFLREAEAESFEKTASFENKAGSDKAEAAVTPVKDAKPSAKKGGGRRRKED
ncbi:hypothetical protein [Saccharopolyspora taberi]|uniref:Uncharacterized protein n=1 Tax=Saccharopolyspora taberi TaxID=60895 RepID=A0ABN3VM78_9PSEU